MRKTLTLVFISHLFVFLHAQNIGLGITNPDERLHVDSVIRIGKNQPIPAGSTRKNLLKFGDGNFVTIGEQDRDDRLIFNAGAYGFRNGRVGIGLDSARERLEVNGGMILGYTSGNLPGTIRYDNENNDVQFRDNSGYVSLKNNYFTYTSYSLEDTARNTVKDLPATDITVQQDGVYLINYYVDAYNTFTLNGDRSISTDANKLVHETNVYLYNKTQNISYQRMRIDFLNYYNDYSGAAQYYNYSLPPHEISGVVAAPLHANDRVGIKMMQSTDSNGFGTMRVKQCTITLVRLY